MPSSKRRCVPTWSVSPEASTVAFISASGFSELGISVASAAEAEIKATVIDGARRVVVALDHSKVGITDFARICDLDEIDVLVIDESTPELEALCARHKIELISAPVDPVMATATG